MAAIHLEAIDDADKGLPGRQDLLARATPTELTGRRRVGKWRLQLWVGSASQKGIA